jgi:hypothetical protein
MIVALVKSAHTLLILTLYFLKSFAGWLSIITKNGRIKSPKSILSEA